MNNDELKAWGIAIIGSSLSTLIIYLIAIMTI